MEVISNNGLKTLLAKIKEWLNVEYEMAGAWLVGFYVTGETCIYLTIPKTSRNQQLTVTKIQVRDKDLTPINGSLWTCYDLQTQWFLRIGTDLNRCIPGPVTILFWGKISSAT